MPGPDIGQVVSGPGVEHAGALETRVTRLENWIDFLANYTALPLLTQFTTTTATAAPNIVGGATIPWGALRRVLQWPDDRWDGWASGWVQNAGGSTTIRIYYQDNTTATHQLATQTFAANPSSATKVQLGPFPVRGTFAKALGVPAEEILSIGLSVTVSAGTAYIGQWDLYLRQSPTRS